MKRILYISIVSAFFTISCSSTKVEKNSNENENEREKDKEFLLSLGLKPAALERQINGLSVQQLNHEVDQKTYLEANKSGNCSYFKELAKNSELEIVRKVAVMRSIKFCNFLPSELVAIWSHRDFDDGVLPEYLQNEFLSISSEMAKTNKLLKWQAIFKIRQAKRASLKSEKVKYYLDAIEIANKSSNEKLASEWKKGLEKISPIYGDLKNKENFFRIAKDYESIRKYAEARKYYDLILSSSGVSLAEINKTLNAKRLTYKQERKLSLYLEKTLEMENDLYKILQESVASEDNEKRIVWFDAVIQSIKALWTDHQSDAALEKAIKLQNFKGGTNLQYATLYYTIGLIHQEKKNIDKAAESFKLALNYKITDQNLQESIKWSLLWNSYLNRKFEDFIILSDSFVDNSGQINPFKQKVLFWKGMALLKSNRANEANIIFENAWNADPYNYYGILSKINLSQKLEKISIGDQEIMNFNFELDNKDIKFLLQNNERAILESYLKINRPNNFNDTISLQKWMNIYRVAGFYQGANRIISSIESSKKLDFTNKYLAVIFPTPYSDIYDKFSKKYDLPKSLLYAITRQESIFVAHEKSGADAYGLMQIIPELAQKLSSKYSIKYSDYDDLYNPEINIEMGTAGLKENFDNNGGRFIPIVAMYNASGAAVTKWYKERYAGDSLEFIENIPYEETRNYVKLVFRNWTIYSRFEKDVLLSEGFFEKRLSN